MKSKPLWQSVKKLHPLIMIVAPPGKGGAIFLRLQLEFLDMSMTNMELLCAALSVMIYYIHKK